MAVNREVGGFPSFAGAFADGEVAPIAVVGRTRMEPLSSPEPVRMIPAPNYRS